MSVHAVEKVFWEFGNDPARIAAFRADPQAYLAAYPLTPGECDAIARQDLKALADQGVSTLLTMMVWPLFHGPEGMPFDYLKHMQGSQAQAP